MRLRNVKNKKELINESEVIVNEPKQKKGSWQKEFGNNNPIYLEIGMGFGKFIINNALKNPKINYIGLEKFDNVIVRTIENVKDEIPNLRFIREDALNLKELFGNKELSRIFLNFSDPWPKNRHEKRRLMSKNFLVMYEDILKGEIHLKTDNNNLFEYSIESLSNNGYYLKNITLNLLKSNFKSNITTEYEERFNQKGKSINRLEAYKK